VGRIRIRHREGGIRNRHDTALLITIRGLAVSHAARNPVSLKLPLAVVAGLSILVLATAMARWSGESIRSPDAPVISQRDLRFEDRPDGSVAVLDATSGQVIDSITGEAGFARGTLRGFARERRIRGLGPEAPLQLVARSDGRLTLIDPLTGHIVDLESFGAVNAGVFARMLPKPSRGVAVSSHASPGGRP
jgi:putative photosynthetic complex assembly protein